AFSSVLVPDSLAATNPFRPVDTIETDTAAHGLSFGWYACTALSQRAFCCRLCRIHCVQCRLRSFLSLSSSSSTVCSSCSITDFSRCCSSILRRISPAPIVVRTLSAGLPFLVRRTPQLVHLFRERLMLEPQLIVRTLERPLLLLVKARLVPHGRHLIAKSRYLRFETFQLIDTLLQLPALKPIDLARFVQLLQQIFILAPKRLYNAPITERRTTGGHKAFEFFLFFAKLAAKVSGHLAFLFVPFVGQLAVQLTLEHVPYAG
uniref:Uncharacterized protein n=1 Tax=Anopheles maculatus TaxID=74869 RepID=A0A182SFJ3_9DIPT